VDAIRLGTAVLAARLSTAGALGVAPAGQAAQTAGTALPRGRQNNESPGPVRRSARRVPLPGVAPCVDTAVNAYLDAGAPFPGYVLRDLGDTRLTMGARAGYRPWRSSLFEVSRPGI
jgi:hypothetical protein